MSTVTIRTLARMIAVGTAAVSPLALPGVAAAEPAAPSSCVGHEAVGISPPGSSDEFPGGMAALHVFIVENFPGLPQGAIIRTIAHLHEGSHQACDEALEG